MHQRSDCTRRRERDTVMALKSLEQVFTFGMALKKQMIEQGVDNLAVTCPRCGGVVHGQLAGWRKHFHMRCEEPGCMVMME